MQELKSNMQFKDANVHRLFRFNFVKMITSKDNLARHTEFIRNTGINCVTE